MQAIVNGTRIAYTDEGQGFPILFLHGSQVDRGVWSKQVDEFKTRFRVIAPDLRGFGQGDLAADSVSIHRFARDVHALMEHLVTGPVILAGQSMGGLVALAFTGAFPELVRGLVLVGMKTGMDSVRDYMAGSRPGDLRLDPAAPPDLGAVLEHLRVPTLVIAGTDDTEVPPGESVALARTIPGAQLNLIPKAGHLVAFEQAAAFNEVVRNWLAWGSNGFRRKVSLAAGVQTPQP
jgi:pimeloyl-ACP methyl ester carboxylesterase